MNIKLNVKSRAQSNNISTLATFFCKDCDGCNFLISCDNSLIGHQRLYALLSHEYVSIEVEEARVSDERIDSKGHFYKRLPPGSIDVARSTAITCEQLYIYE